MSGTGGNENWPTGYKIGVNWVHCISMATLKTGKLLYTGGLCNCIAIVGWNSEQVFLAHLNTAGANQITDLRNVKRWLEREYGAEHFMYSLGDTYKNNGAVWLAQNIAAVFGNPVGLPGYSAMVDWTGTRVRLTVSDDDAVNQPDVGIFMPTSWTVLPSQSNQGCFIQ